MHFCYCNYALCLKICNACGSEEHICKRKWCECGSKLNKAGKTPGQLVGSTALAGFKVSSSRPKDTTLAAGCNVSDGHPLGSTLAAGYNVFMSSGHPNVLHRAAGYNIGLSNGRPEGTTLAVGYNVSITSGMSSCTAHGAVACTLSTT